VATANGHQPAVAEPELMSLSPGKLARRLNGQRVIPNLWANRRLIASTLGGLLGTIVANRRGSRYRLLGHLWIELQRFLAPGIRNVDLADLHVDGTMVEGDVSRHCRLVLCAMGKLLDVRNVFEIGTFQGQTTWLLARNNPQACIFTLDLPSLDAAKQLKYELTDPEYFVAWNRGIRFAGTPEAAQIRQLFGDSATFDFSPYRGTMDLVFIDGSHSYDYVKSDTEAAFRMLSDRGTIVWDDYLYYPGMYQLLNQLSPTLDRPIFHIVGTRLAVYSRVDILNAGWPALASASHASS
jgi:hypothetical protein